MTDRGLLLKPEQHYRGSDKKNCRSPEVAGPHRDASHAIVYADAASAIVEDYRGAMDFPLEGIEALSGWRFILSRVAYRC